MVQAKQTMKAKVLRQKEGGEFEIWKESHYSWKAENKGLCMSPGENFV